jgi:tetratricopeptide (TPR) repeat protein
LKGDKVTLGEVPAGETIYRERWIPMERLLAVKQSDPEYRAERLAPQFYAESWALVHLLLFDDESLTRPTDYYLTNLNIGVSEPDAFAQAFPFDKKGLDERLQKLIKDRLIRVKTITYAEGVSVDNAPISAMTAIQADAQMARMALQIGLQKKIAAPLAAAALKENLSDPAVRALSARIAADGGGREDIEDLARALEKGGTNDPQLRIDIAATLLSLSQSKVSGNRAFAILDDLVHTDSAPLEAIGLWAEAAQMTQVDWAKMVPVLESGTARAPHNFDLLRQLAAVHERLGESDKARDCYDRIILVSDKPEERLWAQKQEDSGRRR